MREITSCLGIYIMIVMIISCKPQNVYECGDLPSMPMMAIYENSLEYAWSQKKVLESKLLSDMETMRDWEHKGTFGSLTLSDEKTYKGKYALLGGCGLLFLGALLTVISFVVAIVRDGDRFAIFWKTMLIGLLLIIGGIVDFVISKSKRD